MTRGAPGAASQLKGKTTWAKKWVAAESGRTRANRDDLREMLFGEQGRLSFEKEEMITTLQREMVKSLLRRGVDVVADDMNLRIRYVREWRKLADLQGADFEVVDFEIDLKEAIARDLDRAHLRHVGEPVISDLYRRFTRNGKLPPIPPAPVDVDRSSGETYVPAPWLPQAVMVDIDGTLALMQGRSPYDLSRVNEDDQTRRSSRPSGTPEPRE